MDNIEEFSNDFIGVNAHAVSKQGLKSGFDAGVVLGMETGADVTVSAGGLDSVVKMEADSSLNDYVTASGSVNSV